MAATRLTREKNGAMLGGVCAGIANTYHVDATLVRVAFVLLTILSSGLGLVFYVAAWLVMPASGQASMGAGEIARANIDDVVTTAKQRVVDLTRARPDTIKSGARRAADDLARAARGARDTFSMGGTTTGGATPDAAAWRPPEANPRARHGGFKPPRNRPPVERV